MKTRRADKRSRSWLEKLQVIGGPLRRGGRGRARLRGCPARQRHPGDGDQQGGHHQGGRDGGDNRPQRRPVLVVVRRRAVHINRVIVGRSLGGRHGLSTGSGRRGV